VRAVWTAGSLMVFAHVAGRERSALVPWRSPSEPVAAAQAAEPVGDWCGEVRLNALTPAHLSAFRAALCRDALESPTTPRLTVTASAGAGAGEGGSAALAMAVRLPFRPALWDHAPSWCAPVALQRASQYEMAALERLADASAVQQWVRATREWVGALRRAVALARAPVGGSEAHRALAVEWAAQLRALALGQ
jgi:hypothetical protein